MFPRGSLDAFHTGTNPPPQPPPAPVHIIIVQPPPPPPPPRERRRLAAARPPQGAVTRVGLHAVQPHSIPAQAANASSGGQHPTRPHHPLPPPTQHRHRVSSAKEGGEPGRGNKGAGHGGSLRPRPSLPSPPLNHTRRAAVPDGGRRKLRDHGGRSRVQGPGGRGTQAQWRHQLQEPPRAHTHAYTHASTHPHARTDPHGHTKTHNRPHSVMTS